MATTAEAIAAVRARLNSAALSYPLYYDMDDAPILPDTPTTFGYVEFKNFGATIAGYGGGRGNNLYRNSALVNIFVFSPIGYGPEAASNYAEPARASLASYRNDVISCFGASNIPLGPGSNLAVPGLISEVNNYMCALVEVELIYDQIS